MEGIPTMRESRESIEPRYSTGPEEMPTEMSIPAMPHLEQLLDLEQDNNRQLSEQLSHRKTLRTELQHARAMINDRLAQMAEVDSDFSNMLDLPCGEEAKKLGY